MGSLTNPVVGLTIVLVVSVIALIGAAVLGLDKGVLFNMGRKDFARGLITYLFAVVTIGTAAILVLSALTGNSGNALDEKQFNEGKEILSLLLGIFGTIVGYYFGAESGRGPQPEGLKLSSLDVTPDKVQPGASVTAKAVVMGGVPPYRFGVAIGNDSLVASESAPMSGWLMKEVPTRALAQGEPSVVRLMVSDAAGTHASQSAPLQLTGS